MRVLAPRSGHSAFGSALASRASLPRVLNAALLIGAVAYVAAFVIAAAFRLSFPYPLEVTESASFRQIERILHGQPLYVAPTLEHVPLIYGPVYFYVSACVALLTGLSYTPLRLVSLAASLGTLTLVALFVHRETRSLAASVVATGLLAATYPLGQTAFDLGRVDALFVFFLVAGLYLLYAETCRAAPRWFAFAVAGCLIGLAGLTKAPIAAAPVAVAGALYTLVTRRGYVVPLVIALLTTTVCGLLLLRLQSGPWPTWYLLDLLRMHEVRDNHIARFWFSDVLPRFTLPLLLGPVFVVGCLLRGERRPAFFYALVSLALVGVAWASRSNNGASTNVLLPAYVLIALLLGLGLHEVRRQLAGARGFLSYALALVLLQFALVAYNPRLGVPYRSDQWADERLANRLAVLPGQVFAPNLDGYLRTSDKAEQPYFIAVGDMVGAYGGTPTPAGVRWQAELAGALEQHRFQSVVLRDEDCCSLQELVVANGYTNDGPLFPPDDEFWRLKTSHTPDVHLYTAPGS